MSLAEHLTQIYSLAQQGRTLQEIAANVGVEIGEVQSVLTGGATLEAPPLTPGVPTVRKFPFAYDTPGLDTGHTVFAPRIGDLLLDAWLEIDVGWDGTTPQGDAGSFVSGSLGWWASPWGPVDMTDRDVQQSSELASQPATLGTNKSFTPSGLSAVQSLNAASAWSGPFPSYRIVPAQFAAPDPIKVVVSRDGTPAGGGPGATQGLAALYVVMVTPAG